jgi:hypothetical protein
MEGTKALAKLRLETNAFLPSDEKSEAFDK